MIEMEIRPFRERDGMKIADLIVNIQQNEFGIPITAEDQPDLKQIPDFYQKQNGNFWVAVHESRIVGTVALLDIGNQQGALRKMFVDARYRGTEIGTAGKLLHTLLDWAKTKHFREIWLGTTPKFLAAHRFYEKNGFTEIEKMELPAAFPVMKVDTKFYVYTMP